jgi:hypothetical protein
MPATPSCPEQKPEVFIAGTEPVGSCPLHGNGRRDLTVSRWDDRSNPAQSSKDRAPGDTSTPRRTDGMTSGSGPIPYQPPPAQTPNAPTPNEDPKKKKGFFGKLKDVFK